MGGLLGPTLAHYEILERLDAGGMGDIYHARDTRLGRSVALKVLPAEMAADPDRIARFEREAKALAALSHPNIVTIYSIEEAEGVHFLTMELIRGRTLTQILPEFGLALSQLFDLAIPLCDALAAAHARGIVHRDLKPANLMVTDEGRLKVLDFGLAKLQEASSDSDTTDPDPFSVTQQGHIMGTIPYMSPEQAQGAALDARSDFFSLGIVLYEMASGQRPFEGGSTLEVLSAILKESPRPLTEVKPGVPVHLEEIVERCLEKEPSRRFESAAEIRDELQAVQRQVLGTSNRNVSLLFSLPASTGEIALDALARATRRSVPGACWMRCDLRTHSGLRAEDSMDPERVAATADQYIEACRRGAGGEGVEMTGLTEPNSIASYRLLRPYFEAIAARAAAQGVSMPAILPGLELIAGEQTPTRFLLLFSVKLAPERIDGLLRFLFDGRERFDESGQPMPAAATPELLLDRLEAYCRPPGGGPETPAVVLLADADGHHGQLRPHAGSSKAWHGFLARGGFGSLSASFRDLVVRWSASRDGVDLQTLTPERRSVFARKAHWPIVEASDPDHDESIGTAYTWLKLELADLEGVRLALLDPDSRLRTNLAGPPGQSHAHIRRVIVRTTDFFEELVLPLSPCLTALIGGRGSGKSTVIECLRFALDRARPADFQENEAPVRESVEAFRSTRKRARDFGESPGIFLPGSQVELELTVAEREYRVVWSAAEGPPRVVTADGATDVGLDVRALLTPRILSQGQIAQIAKDPAAQRRELDALLDSEAVRLFEGRRRSVDEELARLQLRRHKLEERQALLPARETELRRVRDQIELLERGGHRETLELYEAVQHEKSWLDGLSKALESAGREVKKSGQTAKRVLEPLGPPPAGPARDWTDKLLREGREALAEAARALEKQAKSLESVREALRQERARVWRPLAKEAKTRYTQLRKQMEERGVDFGQHEKLVSQRTQLEREVAELAGLRAELQDVRAMLAEVRSRLVGLGRERVERRRALAGALEQQDADVRMEVVGFGDRREMLAQRERWFAGTGLREQDWELLVDHLYAEPSEDVPERLLALVEALREDVAHTRQGGGALDAGASAVSRLLGDERGARLSRHFFKAVQQGDRVRLDEMERFVPEDWVETRVRAADGSFRPVTQGSVGQRSTAVLSLLLSAGDQPLIIDQPEDDLDNQYVYSAVVGLLRRQKFTRQILIATHNANIPVNGDAELIVALGVRGQERLGGVLAAGSIDRPEVKAQVSAIMEGSAEAFRLRRERYGY